MAAPVASDRSAPAIAAAADSRQALEAIAPPDAPLAGFSGRGRGQPLGPIAPPAPPLAGFPGTRRVPPPVNEPVKSYAPGSPEKLALKARLASMAKERIEIPIIIGGQEVRAAAIG